MKKVLLLLIFVSASLVSCDTARQVLEGISTTTGGGLTQYEMTAGLREALSVGTKRSASQLSAADGFFKNAAIKILLPEEAKNIETTLRRVGMGSVVDKAILSMNRAAEDAAKGASNIFVNAISQMTINDAVGILRGGDFAATNYFKGKTTDALTTSFRPVIENALKNTNATKYWGDVISLYNQFSKTPVNTDLSAFVTQKAMDGIFYQVGLEEQKIRRDPVARSTEILKKVFGSQLVQGNP